MSEFLRLIADGSIEEVRAALVANPALANERGPHPFWGGLPQPLHIAVENGRAEILTLLLDAGADPNGQNDAYDDWSPLMLALQRKRPDLAAELQRRGARAGLFEALLSGDDTAVEALLAVEGLPSKVPNLGSALNFARTPKAVDLLLAAGASADDKDKWGVSPADELSKHSAELLGHLAARCTGLTLRPAQYARLGDIGALSAIPGDQLRDPAVIHAAVDGRHLEVVRWLVTQHGASCNVRRADQSQQTPLHAACWNGDVPLVELLLDLGADPTLRDMEHNAEPREWAETALTMTHNPACQDVIRLLDGAAS